MFHHSNEEFKDDVTAILEDLIQKTEKYTQKNNEIIVQQKCVENNVNLEIVTNKKILSASTTSPKNSTKKSETLSTTKNDKKNISNGIKSLSELSKDKTLENKNTTMLLDCTKDNIFSSSNTSLNSNIKKNVSPTKTAISNSNRKKNLSNTFLSLSKNSTQLNSLSSSYLKLMPKLEKRQKNLLPKTLLQTNKNISSVLSKSAQTDIVKTSSLISDPSSTTTVSNNIYSSSILLNKPTSTNQLNKTFTSNTKNFCLSNTLTNSKNETNLNLMKKSVKEVITNICKTNDIGSTSSENFLQKSNFTNDKTNEINSKESARSDALKIATSINSNILTNENFKVSNLPSVKIRKRSFKNLTVKKKSISEVLSLNKEDQTTSTNSYILPNMLISNQLKMAPGNLIPMSGCMQQFFIQSPSTTNSQQSNLIPMLSSQPLFLTPTVPQLQQAVTSSNTSLTTKNDSNTTLTVPSSNTAQNNSNVLYVLSRNSSNNKILMPVRNSNISNGNPTHLNTTQQNNSTSISTTLQSFQNNCGQTFSRIQPKTTKLSTTQFHNNSVVTSRAIFPYTTKKSISSLNSINASCYLPVKNIEKNLNPSQQNQQILCFSSQQAQPQFISSPSLNNSQISSQHTSYSGASTTNTTLTNTNSGKLIQIQPSDSMSNNNYTIFTLANTQLNSIVSQDFDNKSGLLLNKEMIVEQNDCLQSSINNEKNTPNTVLVLSQKQKRKNKSSNLFTSVVNERDLNTKANLTQSTSTPINTSFDNNVEEEENEPPALLCQDESANIQSSFLKEAELMRRQFLNINNGHDTRTGIKHVINNFVIEESSKPFPCENAELLNDIKCKLDDKNLEENEIEKENSIKSAEFLKAEKYEISTSKSDENKVETKKEISKKLDKKTETINAKTSEILSKKKGRRSGRQNELKGLLLMDFGPGKTPFQTTSIERYTEEVILEARQQQRCLAFVKPCSETSFVTSEHNSSKSSSELNGVKKSRKRLHDQNSSFESSTISIENKQNDSEQKKAKRVNEHELWGDERCICCQLKFKDLGRRHPETPQYCSKICRKKSKKQQKVANCLSNNKNNEVNSVDSIKEIDLQISKNEETKNETIVKESLESPAFSSTNTSPTTMALNIVRKNIGVISSPNRVKPCSSAFSIKMQTPQKVSNESIEPSFPVFQTNTECNTLPVPIPLVPATSAIQVAIHSGVNAPLSNTIMSFIPSGNQFSTLNASNYSVYPHLQPSTFDPFYQQKMQNLQSQSQNSPIVHSSLITPSQTPLRTPQIMMFQSTHGSNTQSMMNQSLSTLTPSNTSQMLQQHYLMQKSSSSLNNSNNSNISSPVSTTPKSVTPNPMMTLSAEKNLEIQQLQAKGICNWTTADVSRWANIITNSTTNGDRFLQQEIDGEALLLFKTALFQSELGLKLGPAVKLNNALNALAKPSSPSYMQKPEMQSLIACGVCNWTADEVGNWANIVTKSSTNGETFVQQEIDGASLTLLKAQQFQNELGFKLGPALKLNDALRQL